MALLISTALAAQGDETPPTPPIYNFGCRVTLDGRAATVIGSTGVGTRRLGPILAGGRLGYRDDYPNAVIQFSAPDFAGRTPTSVESSHGMGGFAIHYSPDRRRPFLVVRPAYPSERGWRLEVLTGQGIVRGACNVEARRSAPIEAMGTPQ